MNMNMSECMDVVRVTNAQHGLLDKQTNNNWCYHWLNTLSPWMLYYDWQTTPANETHLRVYAYCLQAPI